MTDNDGAVTVEFDSGGETVAGRLFRAEFGDGPAPAVAILGPMTFQKEQLPLQYARRLAACGFTALIFDPRYRGESGGEPRCYEDPVAKVEDLNAAVGFLDGLPDTDSARLAVVGACMGGSGAITAAAGNPLIKAIATVTGQYRDHATDVAWLGGEDAFAERLARGQEARAKYDATGEVAYVPAVDFVRPDVGMPGELVHSWYQLWADRGQWENRYAVMSDAALLPFEGLSAAARLTKPFLMIHGDQSAFPDTARRHFAVAPTHDKQLLVEAGTRHLQYYDDPAIIDRTVLHIVDWFSRHLGPAR